MEDFNSYLSKHKKAPTESEIKQNMDQNLFTLISSLAGKFDGKSQSDLIKAIYEEAKKGKEKGTLTNAEIDEFVSILSPMLDEKKNKILKKIANELKKI